MAKLFKWLVPLLAGAALTAWLVNPGLWFVPDLKGMSVDAAITAVINNGFDPSIVYDDGGVANQVTGQAPSAQAIRKRGSKVIVFVSKGTPNEPAHPHRDSASSGAVVPSVPAPESLQPNFEGKWRLNVSKSGWVREDNVAFMPETFPGHLDITDRSGQITERTIIGSSPSGEHTTVTFRTDGSECRFSSGPANYLAHVLAAKWDGTTLVTEDSMSSQNFLGHVFHSKASTYWTLSADGNELTQAIDERTPGLVYGEDKVVTTLVYDKQR